ncbi:MAG: acyl-CoA thioesterase [Candidatus Rokuibacteriota bacterium]
MDWLETYRGTVFRWEVDTVDHFTVAYYFARLQDATQAMLHALGLDPAARAGPGPAAWVTADCHVRYSRELRVGDVFHVRSGVIDADGHGLRLGHEVVDSGDGVVCTRAEQGLALVDLASRARRPLTAAHRTAAAGHRIDWPADTGAASPLAHPDGDDGLAEVARDAVKPSEIDTLGEAGLAAYVQRFSAANAQLLAAFGWTPAYSRAERRGFSTFEFRLRLPGYLRAGDLACVRSGLLHLGNSSLRILHRLANARTGEVVATLEQAGVHFDMDARRPTPLPAALRERAATMLLSRPPGVSS